MLVVAVMSAVVCPDHIAAQQAPGASIVVSEIGDASTYTTSCVQQGAPGANSSATCNSTTAGGLAGSARSSSDNALRTVSGAAVMTNSGAQGSTGEPYAMGYGWQYSALTVTGTPAPNDKLVFRFLTNQWVSGFGGTGDAAGGWELLVDNATSGDAEAYQTSDADGTTGAVTLVNAQQTIGGVDLFLPFTSGGTFEYSFGATGSAVFNRNQSQPPGATVNGSLTATLQRVDAITGDGEYISSAVFDSQTRLGTIDVTTAPEPSSLALIAIGLIGVTPCIRRRRCSHQYGSLH